MYKSANKQTRLELKRKVTSGQYRHQEFPVRDIKRAALSLLHKVTDLCSFTNDFRKKLLSADIRFAHKTNLLA